MNLGGWDYYDLQKEIQKCNMFELLLLYRREKKKFQEKCVELINNGESLNDLGKEKIEKECKFLEGSEMKIALEIADRMTNDKK